MNKAQQQKYEALHQQNISALRRQGKAAVRKRAATQRACAGGSGGAIGAAKKVERVPEREKQRGRLTLVSEREQFVGWIKVAVASIKPVSLA